MMRQIGLDPDPIFARVFLDDVLIEKAYWERVRPKAGHTVTVRVIPTGGGGDGSGSGGKNALRIVATIAILAVAIYVSGGAAAGLLGPAFAAGTFGAAALGVGISVAGSLAINALIPPPKPKLEALSSIGGASSPALSITGSSNRLAPYAPIPRVYGRHKMFPPLGARPFTEIEGNDQYLRLLFVLGYGPLAISDLKIGATPLEEFDGVETEFRYGLPGETAPRLFSQSIHEDALSILLTQAADWQSRTTQTNARRLSIDVTFPGGLVHFATNGPAGPQTVQIDVEYRLVGGATWLPVPTVASAAAAETSFAGANNDLRFTAQTAGTGGNSIAVTCVNTSGGGFLSFDSPTTVVSVNGLFIQIILRSAAGATLATAAEVKAAVEASAAGALIAVSFPTGNDGAGIPGSGIFYLSGGAGVSGPLIVTDNRATPIRRGLAWEVATDGQYDVRARRATTDTNDGTIRDQVFWSALRTIAPTAPVGQTGLAMIAMRIKATDQLNGTVDRFNCIAESILPDWNGSGWIATPTSNPAAIHRDILQGTANARALADDRVDLTTLQDWHEACTAAGRKFNAVIDFRTTVFELLKDVAAIGRASFGMRDGTYSVIQDVAQSTPIQHFTPRNSWGFRGTKTFLDLPHALKVRFINPEADWQQDERIVYDDGYNADGANGLTVATKFETLDLLGVTDSEQAWREGRYHIAVARLRPETYELNTDIENLVCTRGDLVRVTHDVPLWGNGWGRIQAVTLDGGGEATAITVDELFAMGADVAYAVRIRKSTGASVVQQIDTVVGHQRTVTFTTAIAAASAPEVGDLVLFGVLNNESVELLVKAIAPGPDFAAKLTLLDAAPGVHTADTGTIPAFDSHITLIGQQSALHVPAPIVDQVQSDESVLLRSIDGSFEPRIFISFHFASGPYLPASHLQVQFRESGSTSGWTQIFAPVSGLSASISITPVQEGLAYDVMIRGVGSAGTVSEWAAVHDYTVIGKTTSPPDVATFTREGDRLSWTYPEAPPDLAGFLVRRHFGQRTSWDDAQPIHAGVLSQSFLGLTLLDVGIVTYLVKAIDVSGLVSANPAMLVLNLGDALVANLVFTEDKGAAGFPGTLTNGVLTGGQLEADAVGSFWSGDDLRSAWNADADLFWTQQYREMSYLTSILPDALDVPCDILLDATVTAQAWRLDYRISGASLFWGADVDPFWTSDADAFWSGESVGTGEFSPWPGRLGQATRQVYEFRLTTQSGVIQGIVSGFVITLDMPDIVERLNDIAIGNTGTRLPITRAYKAIANVTLTVQDDGGSAISAKVVDKDEALGPLVKCLDAAGSLVAGSIDCIIQGY